MWQHANIGSTTGSSRIADDTCSVTASSPGTLLTEADGCCFIHLPREGDFALTARVPEISHAPCTSVAGIMLRESLAVDAAHVSCLLVVKFKQAMLRFRVRPTAGAENVNLQNIAGVSLPCSLRLVRNGDVFSAFYSADGVEFTEFSTGAVSLKLPAAALLGLAVTQENAAPGGAVCTTFDHISLDA
jgi:hypothetical protein